MSLSISTAWDETKAMFASDGRLFASVALALIGVPSMISALIEPQGMTLDNQGPLWMDLLLLAFMILALVGQLALVRLALKPSITVGGAIAHGARRMPVYLVTALIIGLGLVALVIPLAIIARLSGVPIDGSISAMTPALALIMLAIVAIAFFVAVRMLMGTPVASAEQAGPIAIIKRSWTLTRGVWWRLFAFMLLLLIGAVIVLVAISAVIGTVVALALGPIEPMSASALLVGLFQGLFNAAFTALFAVMLARIYVQLSGRKTVEAPKSGT